MINDIQTGEPKRISFIPLSARICERAKAFVFGFESSLPRPEKHRKTADHLWIPVKRPIQSRDGPDSFIEMKAKLPGWRIPATARGIGKRRATTQDKHARRNPSA